MSTILLSMNLINYEIRERCEDLKKRGDRLDDIKRIVDLGA